MRVWRKYAMRWIKNTDGRPDAVLTFASAAVFVVLARLTFAGLEINLGNIKWVIQTIDGTTIGAVLLPTLGAYVSNKYVNLNFHPDYIRMKKDIDGDGKEDDILVPKDP
jgi:hypothetical protein